MNLFIIIINILIIGYLVYKLIAYILFDSKIRKGKYEIIRLSGFKKFDTVYIIYLIGLIGFGYLRFRINSQASILFITFILISISLIIDFFTTSKNYCIINSIGFKKESDGRLIKWEEIENIDINTYNYEELIITLGGKSITVIFNDPGDIKKLAERIKKNSPETFNKYSDKLLPEEKIDD
jgi:hypothetical protein